MLCQFVGLFIQCGIGEFIVFKIYCYCIRRLKLLNLKKILNQFSFPVRIRPLFPEGTLIVIAWFCFILQIGYYFPVPVFITGYRKTISFVVGWISNLQSLLHFIVADGDCLPLYNLTGQPGVTCFCNGFYCTFPFFK